MGLSDLFAGDLRVANIGLSVFGEEIEKQGVKVVKINWRPPASGKVELIKIMDSIDKAKVNIANSKAVELIQDARPVLIDVGYAIDAIPGMTKHTILHSGPPIEFDQMCGAMKGAVIGALIYEGLAEDMISALQILQSGVIRFAPCHHYDAVGPMAGVISASMPVHVIKNMTSGNLAFTTINEGLGRVLRFGAFEAEVIRRLKFIEQEFAPVLKQAVAQKGGVDLRNITAQALHMGDECHNRNKAATALFLREIVSSFWETGIDAEKAKKALEFIARNEHYYLNLSMAACKCALDSSRNIPYSTVVTAMARNGVEFGITVSGLPDKTWFTGPAQMVEGLLFAGFKKEDANADLGDSAITETMGLGGFAMGAAPAIVQFVGGSVQDAISISELMYEITIGKNPYYTLPPLNFRGSATGIDVLKVVERGILPMINTGIAHKEPGVGQIGAGIVNPPMECFEKALQGFYHYYYNGS